MPRLRYTDIFDNILERCPNCNGDLTVDNGVILGLSDGYYNVWEVDSKIESGILVDISGQVSKGNHSYTLCRHCDEMLINMDVIEEMVE